MYPQEAIEAKRWAKIANALGNRTPKQVKKSFGLMVKHDSTLVSLQHDI